MNLDQLKQNAMMDEAIASAELADTPPPVELRYCSKCTQMTNHGTGTKGGCLKCREYERPMTPPVERDEVEEMVDTIMSEYLWHDKKRLEQVVRTNLRTLTTKHDEKMRAMVEAERMDSIIVLEEHAKNKKRYNGQIISMIDRLKLHYENRRQD